MILNLHPNIDSISPDILDDIRMFDDELISDYFYDPFTFNIGIVSDKNRILGAGIIRVVNELKMTLNPNMSNLSKAKIIKIFMDRALKLIQCNEIISSITKPEDNIEAYSNLLIRHFGFNEDNSKFLRLDRMEK